MLHSLKTILACLILSLTLYAQAPADVYVANTGNDSTGTGTYANPYATIDKARQAIDTIVAASGCGGGGRTTAYTVALRGVNTPSGFGSLLTATGAQLAAGTYYQGATTLTKPLTFGAGDNGCAGFPVVYQSYPGETALISGGIRATGWSTTGFTCTGTCTQYKVVLSSTQPFFETLYYNGVRRFRPRVGAAVNNTCGTSGATCPNLGVYYREQGQVTPSWNSTFAYLTGNLTVRLAVTYIALANNTNSQPPSANWATYTGGVTSLVQNADACTGCGSSPNPTSNTGCGASPCIDRFRYGTIGSPAISQWHNILVPAAGLTYNITSNGITVAANQVTVTTTTGSVARIGQQVSLASISGCTTVANGSNVGVINSITGTTVTYAFTAANQTCGGASGTITFQDPQNDVVLQNWEFYTAPRLRIAGVDTTAGEQILSFNGTFQSSGGNFGPLDSHRFVIENEQDDLTNFIVLPQQWFVDRSSGRPWTLYYNAANGENPNTDEVEIPWMPQVLEANALQFVTFRGLVFKNDNFLIPYNSYIDNQGEPTIPGAVDCQNCQNVIFEFNGFTNTVGDGLEMLPCVNANSSGWCTAVNASAVNANLKVQHNSFWDCGSICLQIGSQNATSDTDTIVPHGVSVTDNLLDGWGRVIPAAFGLNVLDSNTLFIKYNDAMDGYHSALSVCVPACQNGTTNSKGVFNVTASYNHFWNCMQGVTDDGGCLYFAIGGGNGGVQSGTSNIMWNNRVHDVNDPGAIGPQEPTPNGGHCLYLDNMSANVDVEFNVAYRCSSAGMFLSKGVGSGGPNGTNNINNNLFAYTRQAALTTGTPTAWFANTDATSCANNLRQHFNYSKNIIFFDRTYLSSGTGAFKLTSGCAYACTGTYLGFQGFANNLYFKNCGVSNTCPADSGSQTASAGLFASDVCAFHVAATGNSTVQGVGGSCTNSPNSWKYGSFANWTGGAVATDPSSCGGSGSVTADVQSTGEDAGSLSGDAGPNGSVIPWTNAGQQGYPNDNYLLSTGAALTSIGFNFAQTNSTLNTAGRFTNTSFLPAVVATYVVSTFDPSHTNNGDF